MTSHFVNQKRMVFTLVVYGVTVKTICQLLLHTAKVKRLVQQQVDAEDICLKSTSLTTAIVYEQT